MVRLDSQSEMSTIAESQKIFSTQSSRSKMSHKVQFELMEPIKEQPAPFTCEDCFSPARRQGISLCSSPSKGRPSRNIRDAIEGEFARVASGSREEDTITFETVDASMWQLMCLKGELVMGMGRVELLMKRSVLVQLFREMLLLERGGESNAFDIMLNLNYGAAKNSFSQQELNEIIMLYAQHFFPRQYA